MDGSHTIVHVIGLTHKDLMHASPFSLNSGQGAWLVWIALAKVTGGPCSHSAMVKHTVASAGAMRVG